MPSDHPTQTTPLRVGLIGFGLAGSVFHAPLIAAASGLQLTAIVTANPERAALAQATYPQATVYAQAQDLWQNRDELDLVVIASPNRTHKPLALEALNARLAVVVDKPLAVSAADATELAELAEQNGLLLSAYQNRRWDGDFLTLQRLLAEGTLGQVRRYESRFERWRPEPKPGWRQSGSADDAGGVLYDLGSHLIDQALTLFGPVTTVYAELDQHYPNACVDDDSFVALTHRNGVRSHLWMSSVAAHDSHRLRVLGSRAAYCSTGLDGQEAGLKAGMRPDQPSWHDNIIGTRGSLIIGDDRTEFANDPGHYLAYYEQVAQALRQGTRPPVDPRDSASMLAIVEAAQQSAASGQVVTLVKT
ncbi:Gfo/Idh/MocA family oxidoreductase [Aestuariicella hydrocarbonica]|uniref:Gfo/Idh/MocA family oxidoreductase n=1 Tax=Pseudomaricurvus hydrocarbonicus TaxID=1470433 RepID=A0A9E5MME7_9GAMM|nr:Gfo/Idh/MocA family oxidoreductase [Aestuariicella hydrocarbonica]NHO66230.1 Gfo/Idh/MocA family oxidoreductase [Aestuariicella hydrocarbonica]